MTNETNPETSFRIHPETLPGHVSLTVADLENQMTFYESIIGLQRHWREGDSAGMGAGGADLLRLTEIKDARRFSRTTGIYHFAILLPNRRELARAIARLFTLRYPNSPTDHVMTKTTYLDDPEGNTIELYADSPDDGVFGFENGAFVARWADGRPSDGREPLDVEALFTYLEKEDRLDLPMPPETRIGHFHMYVANLQESLDFYHDQLGFDDMGMAAQFRMGMVSAGRYHHHIGFNTWMGEGAPQPPKDSLGLRYISFVVPDEAALTQVIAHSRNHRNIWEQAENGWTVEDPSGNRILLEIKPVKE